MSKKIMKYVVALLFVFALVAPLTGQTVKAAGPEGVSNEDTLHAVYCPKGDSYLNTSFAYLTGKPDGWKMTKLKCRNTKIAAVKILNDKEYGAGIEIRTKKAGTTTVEYTLKKGSQSYSYKCKLVVEKYANPFKSLKIGSKSYTSKFNNTFVPRLSKKVSGKLTYTLKSGYKVQNIMKFTESGKGKKIKKNQKITLNKGEFIIIWVKNKKTDFTFTYNMGVL